MNSPMERMKLNRGKKHRSYRSLIKKLKEPRKNFKAKQNKHPFSLSSFHNVKCYTGNLKLHFKCRAS